jgi:Xaa-Pro aminopeptidase
MQEKITALKNLAKKHSLSGFIIPSNDEFQNEYVPDHLNRLKSITNFDGSYGLAIIGINFNLFFTDGRYLLQATKQLSKDFYIHNITELSTFDFSQYLKKNSVLGFDAFLHSESNINYFKTLLEKFNITLSPVEQNILPIITKSNANQPTTSQAFLLDDKFTGKNSASKIQEICKKLDPKADFLLITNPEAICWLLNIRGHDVKYTPLLLAYALLTKTGKVHLFTDPKKITFSIPNTKIYPLTEFETFFLGLALEGKNIQLDPTKTPFWCSSKIPSKQTIKCENPIELAKAIKNPVEIKGIKKAHKHDGLAVVKFLKWLERNIRNNIDEIQASQKLLDFRKESKDFIYPSFETISAYGDNGAIIHYKPTKKTTKIINFDNLYLLDSGGQYYTGTTDVTRTLCFGKPTQQQKLHFTLVLKGHIAIARIKFPYGTTGGQIDALARQYLWQHGLDYGHGTGHGVGHCLGVHEGPQRISKLSNVPLQEGMILSNEPGFYKENHYGIRIESLLLVKKSKLKGFLEFETLTCIPISIKLVDKTLLTNEEINWLQDYEKFCKKSLQT